MPPPHLIRVGEQHAGDARLKADAQRLDEVDRRAPPRVRVGALNVATDVPVGRFQVAWKHKKTARQKE